MHHRMAPRTDVRTVAADAQIVRDAPSDARSNNADVRAGRPPPEAATVDLTLQPET